MRAALGSADARHGFWHRCAFGCRIASNSVRELLNTTPDSSRQFSVSPQQTRQGEDHDGGQAGAENGE